MPELLEPILVTPPLGAPPLRTFGRYRPTDLGPIESNGADREGKRVVVPTGGATVGVFEVDTGKQTGSFSTKALDLDINTHMRGVWLRPQYGVIASERAIVAFDAAKQKELFVIPTKDKGSDSVRSVALSPAGDVLFFGTMAGKVRGWDLGRKRAGFSAHARDDCDRLAVSPNGKQLATSGGDEVKVWDVASKKCVATFGGKALPLRTAAFSHDGERVFAATSWNGDHTIHELAAGKKKPLRSFAGHRAVVECLVVSRDGNTLVSAGADRTIRIWDLRTGQCRGAFEAPAVVATCRLGDDGRLLTFDSDGAASLWDLSAAPKEPPSTLDEVKHLAFERSTFMVGYFDNVARRGTVERPTLEVLVVDAGSVAELPNPPLVALTADAKTGLVARAQGVMEKWDVTKGTCTSRSNADRGITLLAIAPQGDHAAFVSTSPSRRPWLTAWNIKKNAAAGSREERLNPASVVLPKDGTTALFIGRDHRIIELSLKDFEGDAVRWEEGAWVGDFPVLVPDGERVVSKQTRDKPRVVDGDLLVETLVGKTLAKHTEHAFGVTAVATTSTLCASGDSDGNLHVWKLESGGLLARWRGPAVIRACAFSRDGRLAVGDATGRVRIFDVS